MELFFVFGWSFNVVFGLGIGKLIGVRLKFWDRDFIWRLFLGFCGEILS